MEEKTNQSCFDVFEQEIENLGEKYQNKYFNEILFENVLLDTKFLKSLDIMLKSTNPDMDAPMNALNLIVARQLFNTDMTIATHNRRINPGRLNLLPGYVLIFHMHDFPKTRTLKVYSFIHLTNGDKYIIDSDYNKIYIKSFDSWATENMYLGFNGTQYHINFTNISDYIQIFRDIFSYLKLEETQSGSSACNYFIKFIRVMDRKIQKNFFEYGKFLDPNAFLIVTDLVSEYTTRKSKKVSKLRRLNIPRRRERSEIDIKRLLSDNIETSSYKRMIIMENLFDDTIIEIDPNWDMELEYIPETLYQQIREIFNFKEYIDDELLYPRFKFENMIVFRNYILVYKQLNVVDNEILISEINSVLQNPSSYVNRYDYDPPNLLKYLIENDLIVYNLDELPLQNEWYMDQVYMFYRNLGMVYQNIARNPKYGPSSYEYFVRKFLSFIIFGLNKVFELTAGGTRISDYAGYIIIDHIEVFITNGIMLFIKDPDFDTQTSLELVDLYNRNLREMLTEKGLEEYINRLTIDIGFE